MEHRRDEELLADHIAGRPGAFDALVARYGNELYGFLFRFVGNAALADDLVQETFLQVHLSARAFDPRRSFRPWLYTIAANKARDYFRGRGRRVEQPLEARGADEEKPSSLQVLEAAGVSGPEAADAEETHARVRALIARLPEHLRLMLVLGYFQELPYAEIAVILGIPVGTVKSRLHAAVAQLAKLWHGQARAPAAGKTDDRTKA